MLREPTPSNNYSSFFLILFFSPITWQNQQQQAFIANLAFAESRTNIAFPRTRARIDPPSFQSLNLVGRCRPITHARGRGARSAELCHPSDSEALIMPKDTCRICSAPGEPGQPLFYPCKCSGTIRYIHQDWLARPRPPLFRAHLIHSTV